MNLDPRRPAYRGVVALEEQLEQGRERRIQAAAPVVRKQVQAQWLAKLHDQRPTAQVGETRGRQAGKGTHAPTHRPMSQPMKRLPHAATCTCDGGLGCF